MDRICSKVVDAVQVVCGVVDASEHRKLGDDISEEEATFICVCI